MSLFSDKFRPTQLSKVDYHKNQAEHLINLVKAGDFPNLFVVGPAGAGKKTRIDLILKEIYGPSAQKVHIQNETFETASRRKIELRTINSNYHIELNPSEIGIHDKVVIQALIKETASSATLNNVLHTFKTIVINNADRLTKDAQHSLRRTMEENVSSCRLILCAETSSRIIGPIRSRCLLVRVAAPKHDDIIKILMKVAEQTSCNFLTSDIAKNIAIESNRNLRRALLMLECMKVQSLNNKTLTAIQPSWIMFIRKCAKMMMEAQTVAQLMELRNAFYELESHLIPPEVIMRTLTTELLKLGDERTKLALIDLAACYEHHMRIGSKLIYHFEAFITKFMVIVKRNLCPAVSPIDFDSDDDMMVCV